MNLQTPHKPSLSLLTLDQLVGDILLHHKLKGLLRVRTRAGVVPQAKAGHPGKAGEVHDMRGQLAVNTVW